MAARGTPKRERHRGGGGGVLRVVRAGQRGAPRPGSRWGQAASRRVPSVAPDVGLDLAHGSPETVTTRAGRARSQSAMAREPASSIPTTARSSARLAIEDRALGRGVAGHVAVPVEVVGAEIEHRPRHRSARDASRSNM